MSPNVKRKKLLNYLIKNARDGKLLISEKSLAYEFNQLLDKQGLNDLLLSLCKQEFLEIIYTDRHGEPYLYILVLEKAKALLSEYKTVKKQIFIKLLIASLSAVLTFFIGKLLYVFFS